MVTENRNQADGAEFSGVITALVTPFKDGQICFKSVKNLISHQMQQGVDGFVVCGTTGESSTLTPQEKESILKYVLSEVSHQVPVIMGTGTNSTLSTIAETQRAQKLGASGVLIVTPYYNRPPQRGLLAHYTQVAEATDLPILIYNVPSRTGVSIDVDTIVGLSGLRNIVGIKEATGNIEIGREIKQKTPQSFLLTSGDDATFLKLAEVGGRGVISVASHIIVRKMKELLSTIVVGSNRNESFSEPPHREFSEFNDLLNILFIESNPIPVKAALYMMGLISSDELRLPLVRMSDDYQKTLRKILEHSGVIN